MNLERFNELRMAGPRITRKDWERLRLWSPRFNRIAYYVRIALL